MKIPLLSVLLCMCFSLSQAQTTFDYSTFPSNTGTSNLQLKEQFSLQNFDACWNLTFEYTLSGVTPPPYVLTGKEVVKELTKPIPVWVQQISLDRRIILMDKPIDLPENVKFTPVRSSDANCNLLNGKLQRQDITVPVVMPAGAQIAKNVNESNDIPSERSPFYDAILLQKMLNKDEKDKIVALLSLYGIVGESIHDNEILRQYEDDLLPNHIEATSTVLVASSETEMSTGIQGVGSSFVTTLTEALAQFIAKRVKEELTLAYLSRFRAYLEDKNQTIRIGVLLPESYKVMMEVEPYDYTTYWLAMQEGFQDDVAQYPENTMGFVRAHKTRFKKDDAYAATITGLYLLRGTYRKYSSVAILDSLEMLPEVKNFTSENVGAALRTISLLSRNLHHLETRSNGESESKGWIKSNELVALANMQTRTFFAGLLLTKEKDALKDIHFKISATDSVSLYKVMLDNYQDIGFSKTIGDLLTQLNVLLDKEKQVGKESDKIEDEDNAKKKVRTTFERYETYVQALLNLVSNSGEWVEKLASPNTKITKVLPTLTKFSNITRATIDLTKHMSEKRYSLAFFDVVRLLKEVQGKHLTIDATDVLKDNLPIQRELSSNLSSLGIPNADISKLTLVELITATDNVNSLSISNKKELKEAINRLNAHSDWDWEKLVKYGSFISNVAGADSAAQIVAALEAAANPVGSYRIKHEDRFTVSLNAYGGLTAAKESFRRLRPTSDKAVPQDSIKGGFTLSPYAPVGLSFSWGIKKQWIESLTIFVPVIDVGAAFALRFKNDLKALPDQLAWDNILAPGIHLMAGFRNSPLTVSFGAQYGAGLRKLEYESGKKTVPFSAQSVWVGGTLSVDVPIFTLHVGKGYTRR